MQVKSVCVVAELKAAEQGVIEGYGAVFGTVDSYNDVVAKGAFDASLAESAKSGIQPAMLWQHDPGEPIGVWTSLKEDAKGLLVKGQLADTQRGRDALTLLKMGALTGLSIGYSTVSYQYDEKTDIRTLTEVKLWEVSPVTFPANSDARVSRVKSADLSVNEFEEILRDVGFSRQEAKRIAASGFHEGRQRDVDVAPIESVRALAENFRLGRQRDVGVEQAADEATICARVREIFKR